MQRVVLLAAFILTAATLFAESVPVVLYESKGPDGERVQYRSDTDTLWKQPVWTPGGEGPPLTIEAATKIAMDTAFRQVPRADGVSFGDIKLLKNVFSYSGGTLVTWFWVFTVSPVTDEHPEDRTTEPIVAPPRDIVILLDGKIVDATPAK